MRSHFCMAWQSTPKASENHYQLFCGFTENGGCDREILSEMKCTLIKIKTPRIILSDIQRKNILTMNAKLILIKLMYEYYC
ncbi:hypothetical protein GCM10022405_24840 [Gibbsiella dentisursi]|uniref:Uncharacterized protein n=1 Tax=Gibbsiella dentisursi TaxID=796890 RepID=A0ABP7LD77_9GAMM